MSVIICASGIIWEQLLGHCLFVYEKSNNLCVSAKTCHPPYLRNYFKRGLFHKSHHGGINHPIPNNHYFRIFNRPTILVIHHFQGNSKYCESFNEKKISVNQDIILFSLPESLTYERFEM